MLDKLLLSFKIYVFNNIFAGKKSDMPKHCKQGEALSKLIGFRISQDDAEKLKVILTKEGQSKTGFFRDIIKQAITNLKSNQS